MHAQADYLRVKTSLGTLLGVERKSIGAFYGVPYAAPPIGKNYRWHTPQVPIAWEGEYKAHSYGSASYQPVGVGLAHDPVLTDFSEDCLNINIFAPKAALEGKVSLPVMFWIHGGGFLTGAGSGGIYRSLDLAYSGEVILVTFNYRLGPWGFLRLTDLTDDIIPSTGNEGLKDQLFALQWVHDNIGVFGGDHKRITVFGESAGAMSAAMLLSIPEANKLMMGCICQSGACESLLTPESANFRAKELGKLLLQPSQKSTELTPEQWAQVFNEASAQDILSALDKLSNIPWPVAHESQSHAAAIGMIFAPVGEGSGPQEFLSDKPLESLALGTAKHVLLTAGYNEDEWNFFTAFSEHEWNLTQEQVLARFTKLIQTNPEYYAKTADEGADESDTEGTVNAHELYAFFKTTLQERKRPNHPGAVFAAAFSLYAFAGPIYRLITAHLKGGGQSRGYRFLWQSPLADGVLGACHALEIPFIFGSRERSGLREFTGVDAASERLQATMQKAWLELAHNQAPKLGNGTQWPKLTLKTQLLYEMAALGEKSDSKNGLTDILPTRINGNRVWTQ